VGQRGRPRVCRAQDPVLRQLGLTRVDCQQVTLRRARLAPSPTTKEGMSFGTSMRRVEDEALLSGSAPFTDDLPEAREAQHLILVRSPFPHATFRLGRPPTGARAIVAEDVPNLVWPHLLPGPPLRKALADGRTRFVG